MYVCVCVTSLEVTHSATGCPRYVAPPDPERALALGHTDFGFARPDTHTAGQSISKVIMTQVYNDYASVCFSFYAKSLGQGQVCGRGGGEGIELLTPFPDQLFDLSHEYFFFFLFAECDVRSVLPTPPSEGRR